MKSLIDIDPELGFFIKKTLEIRYKSQVKLFYKILHRLESDLITASIDNPIVPQSAIPDFQDTVKSYKSLTNSLKVLFDIDPRPENFDVTEHITVKNCFKVLLDLMGTHDSEGVVHIDEIKQVEQVIIILFTRENTELMMKEIYKMEVAL